MGKSKDLTGQVFGKLEVIGNKQYIGDKSTWLCICQCGNTKQIRQANLISGLTTACGCLQKTKASIANTKHGKYKTRLYALWLSMKRRCDDKNNNQYKNYGGRGITVCERWMDFQNFYNDMGEPAARMSLDRIDVNGNYEPSNCRWATWDEQGCNRRTNKFYYCNNQSHILSQWSEISGIKQSTLYSRIVVFGWPIEKALTKKPQTQSK